MKTNAKAATPQSESGDDSPHSKLLHVSELGGREQGLAEGGPGADADLFCVLFDFRDGGLGAFHEVSGCGGFFRGRLAIQRDAERHCDASGISQVADGQESLGKVPRLLDEKLAVHQKEAL